MITVIKLIKRLSKYPKDMLVVGLCEKDGEFFSCYPDFCELKEVDDTKSVVRRNPAIIVRTRKQPMDSEKYAIEEVLGSE